jgi:multidrug resistance efflux pump
VQYDEGFTATASTSGTVTGVAVTTGRTVAAGDVLMLAWRTEVGWPVFRVAE